MNNRPLIALLWCVSIPVLRARAVPRAAQLSISDGSTSNQTLGSEASKEEIPRYSVPQYLPCPDQTKSFGKLSDSFTAGHLPSQSEVTGSWVLIGIWLHRDSHPDLNCAGIMRGKILEWVMLAQGYSLGVDMAGTYLSSAFEPDRTQDLSFTIDLGGEASPVFRCRLTQHHSLACLTYPTRSRLTARRICS
jgi:hypothetical protein